jgi:hypothetical protein
VQEQLLEATGARDRRVREADFALLRLAKWPDQAIRRTSRIFDFRPGTLPLE